MKVRSTYGGFLGVAGVPTMVHEGDVFDAEDAVVAAHPALFVEFLEPEPEPKRPALRSRSGKAAKDVEPKGTDT